MLGKTWHTVLNCFDAGFPIDCTPRTTDNASISTSNGIISHAFDLQNKHFRLFTSRQSCDPRSRLNSTNKEASSFMNHSHSKPSDTSTPKLSPAATIASPQHQREQKPKSPQNSLSLLLTPATNRRNTHFLTQPENNHASHKGCTGES